MIHDNRCPECHGTPDLLLVLRDRLVKRCTECGHKWNEEREIEFVQDTKWIRR